MSLQASPLRFRVSFLVLSTFAIGITLSLAQSTYPAPANLTAKIVLYTSNSCCGGSIGFDNVTPDECISLGPTIDPAIYGNSLFVYDIWADGFNAWGYASAFKGGHCGEETKTLEVREPSCVVVPKEDRARSFRWTLESYTFWPPSYIPWTPPSEGSEVREAIAGGGKSLGLDGEAGCRRADWFEYFDGQLGRSRRIEVLGSEEVLQRVTALYSEQDYVALEAYEDIF